MKTQTVLSIRIIKLITLLVLLCTSQLLYAIEKPILVVGADEWPNYTNKDGTGIYFEIIKRAFKDYQIQFQLAPFKQSITKFNHQKIDIMVGVYQDETTSAIFPNWPLDYEYPVVAVYDPNFVQIQHANDFAKLHIGWLHGYRFNRFLSNVAKISRFDSLDKGFALLNNHQLDAVLDYPYNLTQAEQKRFKLFPIFPERHSYIALQHNRFGQILAQQYDQAMLKMRNNGELQKQFKQEYAHTHFAQFSDKKSPMIIYTNSVSLLKNTRNKLDDIDSVNLNFVFDSLQQYQFSYRLIKDMDQIYRFTNQPNVCVADMIKTPKRLKYFYASKPLSLFLGLKLYSTEKLPISNNIDIAALLNSDKKYKLGIASGRSYGKQIDAQLDNVNIQQLVRTPSLLDAMFKQLEKGRFNLMIEYPSVKARYWHSSKPLYSYTIQQSSPFILGHLLCTKSPQNKQFMAQFDAALSELYKNAVFFDSQYRRVAKENKADFKHYFDQAFQIY